MSYHISLRGSTFDHLAWLEEIRSDCTNSPGTLSRLSEYLNGFMPSWDVEEFWLMPVGGIRGVHINRNDEVSLNLPAAASREDYALASRLVSLALKHGATAIDEDGVKL